MSTWCFDRVVQIGNTARRPLGVPHCVSSLTPRPASTQHLDARSTAARCSPILGLKIASSCNGNGAERGSPALFGITWVGHPNSADSRACSNECRTSIPWLSGGPSGSRSWLSGFPLREVALNRIRLECHVHRYWRLQRGGSALTRVWSGHPLKEC